MSSLISPGAVKVSRSFVEFDADGYARATYGIGHPSGDVPIELVDKGLRRVLTAAIIFAMDELDIKPGSLDSAIDVCGSGLPHGPAYSAPLLTKSAMSFWTDISPNNIKYAEMVIAHGKAGDLGDWIVHQQDLANRGGDLWTEAFARACRQGVAQRLNIDKAPEGKYAVATNLFGTESTTDNWNEYALRTQRWARIVKPGGLLIRVWSQNSRYYYAGVDKAGKKIWCPAVPITIDDERKALHGIVREIASGFVPASPLEMDSHSWSGAGWLVGVRVDK